MNLLKKIEDVRHALARVSGRNVSRTEAIETLLVEALKARRALKAKAVAR